MVKQLLHSVAENFAICQRLADQLFATAPAANNWSDRPATDKSRNSAQPRPIIVNNTPGAVWLQKHLTETL